eukprot:TRINITY_DN4905_c0_g1_i2.p3 TRINITY_DN4905_c0_g1~~TRINITY_DN4905_c0_g1_i2.p3  ORF type:complete len:104 (-),score=9.19 TRINITY_DN4905_c0_g1_i2:221-532(-)
MGLDGERMPTWIDATTVVVFRSAEPPGCRQQSSLLSNCQAVAVVTRIAPLELDAQPKVVGLTDVVAVAATTRLAGPRSLRLAGKTSVKHYLTHLPTAAFLQTR